GLFAPGSGRHSVVVPVRERLQARLARNAVQVVPAPAEVELVGVRLLPGAVGLRRRLVPQAVDLIAVEEPALGEHPFHATGGVVLPLQLPTAVAGPGDDRRQVHPADPRLTAKTWYVDPESLPDLDPVGVGEPVAF